MFELLLRNIKSRLKDLREKRERKFRRGAFFVRRSNIFRSHCHRVFQM